MRKAIIVLVSVVLMQIIGAAIILVPAMAAQYAIESMAMWNAEAASGVAITVFLGGIVAIWNGVF